MITAIEPKVGSSGNATPSLRNAPAAESVDLCGAFQLGKSPVDQVEADVPRAIIAPIAGACWREPTRSPRCHLVFRKPTLLGHALGRVTITSPA